MRRGITEHRRDGITLFSWLIVLVALGLSACGEQPVAQKGETGAQGPPGPEGPAGAARSRWGRAGASSVL